MPAHATESTFSQEVLAWPDGVLAVFWSLVGSSVMATLGESAREQAGVLKVVLINAD